MYIVFDIGGTKTRIAASRDKKELVGEPRKIDTPESFEAGIDIIEEVVRDICLGEEVDAVAGGIGGPIDEQKKILLPVNKPALSDWIHKPLVESLSKRLNAPVYLENDSATVGLGEAVSGAGMGHSIVMYLTVSTGVGGLRIIDGKIAPSSLGFEPGHQIIDIDNSICEKCVSGKFEDMISGTATALRFGKKAYEVLDEYVWEEELPQWLAYGLYNSILHWSPDVVVLGGSMVVGDPAISVPKTAEKVAEMMEIFPKTPEIKMAELGDFGGIYGGLAILRQN